MYFILASQFLNLEFPHFYYPSLLSTLSNRILSILIKVAFLPDIIKILLPCLTVMLAVHLQIVGFVVYIPFPFCVLAGCDVPGE